MHTPLAGQCAKVNRFRKLIYHVAYEIERACIDVGVILAYLPPTPYSLDFNPIEESFAELKAWRQKNFILAESMLFEELLHVGMEAIGKRAGNHFKSRHMMS